MNILKGVSTVVDNTPCLTKIVHTPATNKFAGKILGFIVV
jgi:hypothetical protein